MGNWATSFKKGEKVLSKLRILYFNLEKKNHKILADKKRIKMNQIKIVFVKKKSQKVDFGKLKVSFCNLYSKSLL